MIRPVLAAIAALAVVTFAPQSDDFASGNAIGAVGATAAVNLDPGNAGDNIYTVHYFVSVTINAHSSSYGTASLVVAIDGNDGSGWVERASFTYNCSYLSGAPPYSSRTCPAWTHEQRPVTIAGLGLNDDIRLRAKSFSTSNGAGGSFVVRGGDAGGVNPETFNGVTYSTIDASYAVQVGPDGGSQSAFTGSTGNVATFTVQNLGNQGTLTYQLSVVGCTAPLSNCTSDNASVSVGQGATVNTTVRFDAQSSTGTGTITLRATHGTSGTTNDGTINVTVSAAPSYTVQVGPDGGSQSAYTSSTGNVATFTVQNQGNQGTLSYQLSVVGCTAPLINCTSDNASVSVGQGATANTTVRFDAQGSTGTGTITLRATHSGSGATNDGTINVTVVVAPSYAVQVGPDGGSQSTAAGAVGNVATFSVQNLGNQGTLTYQLSVVGCTAPLVNCTSDNASVSVGQGGTVNATVRFDAQSSSGTGTITLRATHGASGTSNDGTINVTVNPASYAVQVGPDGGTGGALMGSTGNLATFTVQNQGNQGTLTYQLSVVGCTTPLANCASTNASVIVGQGATVNTTVRFDAQNLAGSGTITLRATHTTSGASNDGTITVTMTQAQADDFTAGNQITVVNGTAEANLDPGGANSGNYTIHSFVEVTLNAHSSTYGTGSLVVAIDANDGSGWVERGSFTYNCSYLSGAPPYAARTCPAWTHEQQAITVAGLGLNDDIRLRAKSFSTSNGAGGSFKIRGGDGAGSNPETYNGVTYGTDLPPSYAVQVGPDGGSQSAYTGSTGQVATFTVQNLGNQGTLTYALSVVGCTAPLSSCTSDNASVSVAQGATVQTTVRFNTQSSTGTGTITLRATHAASGSSNDGTINVTVSPAPIYTVAVGPDGGGQSVSGGTTGHAATFTVQNQGNQGTLTYAVSIVGCSAPLVNCTAAVGSVTVGQGGTQNATVHFDAQSAFGVGTITVRATHTASGTSDQGTINVTVVALSWVSGGALTLDGRFQLVETALAYDSAGRLTSHADARGKLTSYEYGGNSWKAFLTKVTRIRDATGSANLVTEIRYDANGFVDRIRDEGGTDRYFGYDLFGRLDTVKNHTQVPTVAYRYTYSRTSANGWQYQSAAPNAIATTSFIQHAPTVRSVETVAYVDGLGRGIQHVTREGTSYHVTATQYDLNGREWRSWKTYKHTTAGYDPNFVANATAFYNSYHSTTTAKPYTETAYTPDALSRVKRVTREYIGTTAPAGAVHTYGVDVALRHVFTESADELNKRTRNYTDVFGAAVRTTLGYGSAEATTTQFVTDVLGQRLRSTDPRGLVTTYAYDTRGKLIGHSSPDGGVTASKYDRAGNLRYTQDANQLAAGLVYFTTYDFADRQLTSGQGSAVLSALDPDAASPPALETNSANWLVVRQYDAKPATSGAPWNLFTAEINGFTPVNTTGRLVAIASKSGGSWQLTMFSYNADGDVAERRTFTHATGTTTVLAALTTTVTYVRDLRDALVQRLVTVGGAAFNHWYDYDNRGLLSRTYAATSTTKPGTADVTYTYRPSGQIASRQFAGGPTVPLRYTIKEALYRIGNPGSTTYPFSAQYAYHANGTLSSAQFYSAGSAATAKRFRYVFGAASYDALNRLKAADFSSWSGSAWTSTLAHDLTGITYDVAGNITALRRYRESATLVDNLTYAIASSSNRLNAVTDAVAATTESWDAESGSFTYDANGNMKTAPAPYSVTAVTYNYQNLPESITRAGITSTYRYDEAGKRIAKLVGTGNREMYVLDGEITLAVVTVNSTGTLQSREWNIIAVEKVVGRQPYSGSRRYYHTDLLGSTRTVTTGTTVVESYDFEPWGLLMPGRTFGSGTREGFTGKERDAESGLDYFGARYYMPALGRWASVDPEADRFPQWSPYNYTLNNPLVMVDPDGRCPAFLTKKPCSGAVAIAVGFIPVVGDVVDVASAVVGKDLLTGERLSPAQRVTTLVGTVVGSGRAARVGVDAAAGVASRATRQSGEAGTRAARAELPPPTRGTTRPGGDAAQQRLTASPEAHRAQEAAAANGRSWTTQRRAFWKAEANSPGAAEQWGADNVERMKKGLAPQYRDPQERLQSVELDHTPTPRRDGGTRVIPKTREQHAQDDPFRHLGGGS